MTTKTKTIPTIKKIKQHNWYMITLIIAYILASISAIVSVFTIYTISTTSIPHTIGTNYASTLETTSGETYIAELNIFDNKNKNGEALYELLLNSYTDYEGSNIKGYGLQAVGGYSYTLLANGTWNTPDKVHLRTLYGDFYK